MNFANLNHHWTEAASTFSHLPGAYGAAWAPAVAGVAAAGVVAPWMLKNDDRGYAKTALITTPLLLAGLAAAPGLWEGFSQAGASAQRLWTNRPVNPVWNGHGFDWSHKSPADLHRLREQGGLSEAEFQAFAPVVEQHWKQKGQKMWADFVPTHDEASAGDLKASVREMWVNHLHSISDSNMPDAFESLTDSFGRDMNAALHESRIKAGVESLAIPKLSLADAYTEIMGLADIKGDASVYALRNMKRRLTVARHLTIGKEVPRRGLPGPGFEFRPFGALTSDHKALLGNMRYEQIKQALRRSDDLEVNLAVAEDKILGIRLGRHGEGSVAFGMPNLDTGMMLIGDNLQRNAVARPVHMPGGQVVDLWDQMLEQSHRPIRELEKELETHTEHVGVALEDMPWALENQPDRLNSLAEGATAHIRSGRPAATSFPLFKGGKTLDELSFEDRLEEERAYSERVAYFGNEAGVAKGSGHIRAHEAFLPFVADTETRSNYVIRSVTKSMHIDPKTIPKKLRRRYANEALDAEYAKFGEEVPAFSYIEAEITPQEVAFYRGLPAEVSELRNPEVEAHAREYIGEYLTAYENHTVAGKKVKLRPSHWGAAGRDGAIQKTWDAMVKRFEEDPRELLAARKAGALGEGQSIFHSDFSEMDLVAPKVAHVKTFNLEAIKEGDEFGSGQVIGLSASGESVTSSSSRSRFKSAVETADGWDVYYDSLFRVGTGSKNDDSLKGLGIGTREGEMGGILGTFNTFHKNLTDSTPYSREVQLIRSAQYASTKHNAPLTAAAIAHDTMRRLERIGKPDKRGLADPNALEIVERYREKFADLHFDMSGPVMRENTLKVVEGLEAAKGDRATIRLMTEARIINAGKLVDDLMNDASRYVRLNKKRAKRDHLFRHWLSVKRYDNTLTDHMVRYSKPNPQAFMWNTTQTDNPKQVSITEDMVRGLSRNGYDATLRDTLNQARPLHGDTRKAFDFAQNFFAEGGFKERVGKVIKLDEIQNVKGLFDPKSGMFNDNYTIDLGQMHTFTHDGKHFFERDYMPMPGLDSYRAAANEYGVGGLSLTDAQQELKRLIPAFRSGDKQQIAGAFSKYGTALANQLGGKKGLLRPSEAHANGLSMVIATRATDGPFEMIIHPSQLHRLNPKLREQLKATLDENGKPTGKHGIGVGERHPIAATTFYKLRLADHDRDFLGPNMVGTGEAGRSTIGSDDDGDILNIMPVESEEAAAEGWRAINDTNSPQWRQQRIMSLVQGNAENAEAVTEEAAETFGKKFFGGELKENLKKYAAKVGQDPIESVAQRLAHKETGLYSNLVTNLHLNIENHPTLAGTEGGALLDRTFFELRQVPISAGKGKMALFGLDPGDLWDQFQRGLAHPDRGRGAELMRDAMTKVLIGGGKVNVLRQKEVEEARDLLGVTHQHIDYGTGGLLPTPIPLKKGMEVNVWAESLHAGVGRKLMTEFSEARNRHVDGALDLLTRGSLTAEEFQKALPNIGELGTLAAIRGGGGAMARQTASELGALNNVLTDAVEGVAKGGKGALPILAAGAGLAAVAGILGTRVSSNKHRPEETAGARDTPPGQPVEGSQSNRPRVRMTPAPAQTRTSVVTPTAKNNDIEVQAVAPDRQAAAEAARMTAKLSTRGSTQTTVNYMGGARERLSKLYLKQRLRESLDLDPDA